MAKRVIEYVCNNCQMISESTKMGPCRHCYSTDVYRVNAWQAYRHRRKCRKAGKSSKLGRFFYPWADVDESRENPNLRPLKSPEEARQAYLEKAEKCPVCQESAEALSWIYFSSPDWTWERSCGRAGWMVICDECRQQVSFFLERMS